MRYKEAKRRRETVLSCAGPLTVAVQSGDDEEQEKKAAAADQRAQNQRRAEEQTVDSP